MKKESVEQAAARCVGLVPFYAAGVALLLAAGALLWKKRRRSNAACI